MLKEMPLLRAPEKSRTGIEIKPNVKYPDQTEAAISSPRTRERRQSQRQRREFNLTTASLMQQPEADESKEKARRAGVVVTSPQVMVVTIWIPWVQGVATVLRSCLCV